METTIKTPFNFAKEIQCNFITKNNHSYPGGLPEFITPYLQELQENTIIPDYTTLISITTIETHFEYLTKILKDDAIDTWTLREQEEINKLDLTQGLHIFLYDIYTALISYCQTNKPTNLNNLYESEHIIILDSDSTIGCQE